MRRNRRVLGLAAAMLYPFLYAPLAVVAVYSFNAGQYGASWLGFSWDGYRKLAGNTVAQGAAMNTLILATASTAAATLLGTALAYGWQRIGAGRPERRFIPALLYLPVFLPDIAMAVSLLLFFSLIRRATGWFEPGLGNMIVAHVTFEIPFVAIVVRARLSGMDMRLEEAARDLGADGWQTFREITLPLMTPGIVAGSLLAFTLSLDDFIVSFFTSGPGSTTLPILIYSSVKRGITPEINAMSTLFVAVSVIASVALARWQRRAAGPSAANETGSTS